MISTTYSFSGYAYLISLSSPIQEEPMRDVVLIEIIKSHVTTAAIHCRDLNLGSNEPPEIIDVNSQGTCPTASEIGAQAQILQKKRENNKSTQRDNERRLVDSKQERRQRQAELVRRSVRI